MIERDLDGLQALLDYHLNMGDDNQRDRIEQAIAADERLRNMDAALGRCVQLLKLTAADEAPPPNLTDRTLAYIREREQARKLALATAELARKSQTPDSPISRGRWVLGSMRDVMAVAATLMIVFLVSQPPLRYARHRFHEVACAGQLGDVGAAFASYAADYDGYLPYVPRRTGTRWFVGHPGSNTRNLFLLLRENYLQPSSFACPGAPTRTSIIISINPETLRTMVDFQRSQDVSYSFRLMNSGHGAQLETLGRALLAADRNPLFAGFHGPEAREVDLSGNRELRLANSPNHRDRGQNMLRADGSVEFAADRRIGPSLDDIYTIQTVMRYRGVEEPACESDAFMAP